jgi:hypothetical protein
MITRKGQTGWLLESPGALQTDRYGMSTATARWRRLDVATNVDPGTPIVYGQAHPLWFFLNCDKFTISVEDNGWNCDATFFGVYGVPQPIYDLDLSTAEEPIETHPNFRTTIAGKPGAALHGAQFSAGGDDAGTFLGFNGPFANDTERDEWMGIRSYLSPGAVWRKTLVTGTRPSDLSDVGGIDTPEGSPPTIGSGRNWLYAGLTYEQKGLVFTTRKEWRLSGRRGWNATIYTP